VHGDPTLPDKLSDFTKMIGPLRKKHKIPQEKLARKLGIARSSLACIEKGYREPSAQVLWRLLGVFNNGHLDELSKKKGRR
jgi:transcriptional regulator with XRE-family HTH domain